MAPIDLELRFNRGQRYDRDTVREIQRHVGTFADGIWGPDTITKLRRWQEEHGLDVDGMAGPQVLEAMGISPKYRVPKAASTKVSSPSDQSRIPRKQQGPPTTPPPVNSDVGSTWSLNPAVLRDHVNQALATAAMLAGDAPVDAAHLLTGVLSVGPRRTNAFKELGDLLPKTSTVDPPAEAYEKPTSLTLRPALAAALDLASKHQVDDRLWGRELIAAALLSSPDPRLRGLLADNGRELDSVRDHWLEFMLDGAHDPKARRKYLDWWGRALGETRAGYLSDTTGAEDKLELSREVGALARLIRDEKVVPPLSIGLIGDWGTGKTFFMDLLHERIESLSGRPGMAQRVVQIRFNAWHVSDDNLWASLVSTIFEEIWRELVPEGLTDQEQLEKLQTELVSANGAFNAANQRVEHAKTQLERARLELGETTEQLRLTNLVDGAKVEEFREKLHRRGWNVRLDTVSDFFAAVDQVRTVRDDLGRIATRSLAEPKVLLKAMVRGVLALGAGVAIVLLWSYFDLDALLSSLTSAITFVATLAASGSAFITRTKDQLNELDEAIGGIYESFEPKPAAKTKPDAGRPDTGNGVEQGERGRPDTGNGVEQGERGRPGEPGPAAPKSLEHAHAQLQAAREAAAQAELEAHRLALDYDSLQPPQRLASFLQERVSGGTYRDQEGIISLVRRDFEQLSEKMATWRGSRVAKALSPTDQPIEPIDRIVLYIDDLDRCAPRHVVATLEAIHLLLATGLFVVVVAVDPRWLLGCLEVHYDELFAQEGKGDASEDRARQRSAPGDRWELRRTTPQNYLEKIFQIPFALAPMTDEGYRSYIEHLTGDVDALLPKGTGTGDGGDGRESGAREVHGSGQTAEPSEGRGTGDGWSSPSVVSRRVHEDRGEDTRKLKIQAHERAMLEALAPLVTTPRVAKRLVNVFRLIKAGFTEQQRNAFEVESNHEHRVVLTLLGILYGRPELAVTLFGRLVAGKLDSYRKLGELARELAKDEHESSPNASAREWNDLADIVDGLEPLPLALCSSRARMLSRYSFVTGQYLNTWRGRPARATASGQSSTENEDA